MGQDKNNYLIAVCFSDIESPSCTLDELFLVKCEHVLLSNKSMSKQNKQTVCDDKIQSKTDSQQQLGGYIIRVCVWQGIFY